MSQSDEQRYGTETREGLGALLPAAALLLFGLVSLGYGSLYAEPVPGQYVVITAPGTSALEAMGIVVRSGGALISAGSFDNIIHAASEDTAFAETLRQAGAWLVLPAPAFLGCEPNRLES